MFCQNCGTQQEASAKFCHGCGKPVAGEVTRTNEPSQIAEPLQEKIFWSQGGVLVSDVVFKTGSGSSYPIRNISSVSVTAKRANGFVAVMGIALTLLGLFSMMGAGNVAVGFVLLGFSAPFWFMASNTAHQLKIGAGGVLQTAIESPNASQLNNIARAINDSILYIQRGA